MHGNNFFPDFKASNLKIFSKITRLLKSIQAVNTSGLFHSFIFQIGRHLEITKNKELLVLFSHFAYDVIQDGDQSNGKAKQKKLFIKWGSVMRQNGLLLQAILYVLYLANI